MTRVAEFGEVSRDNKSPDEIFRWFAEKPVKSALIIALKDDGTAECSVCNGTPALFTIAADTLMQIIDGQQIEPVGNRAERRARGRRR